MRKKAEGNNKRIEKPPPFFLMPFVISFFRVFGIRIGLRLSRVKSYLHTSPHGAKKLEAKMRITKTRKSEKEAEDNNMSIGISPLFLWVFSVISFFRDSHWFTSWPPPTVYSH